MKKIMLAAPTLTSCERILRDLYPMAERTERTNLYQCGEHYQILLAPVGAAIRGYRADTIVYDIEYDSGPTQERTHQWLEHLEARLVPGGTIYDVAKMTPYLSRYYEQTREG